VRAGRPWHAGDDRGDAARTQCCGAGAGQSLCAPKRSVSGRMKRIILTVCSGTAGLLLLLFASSWPTTEDSMQPVEIDQATVQALQTRYRLLSKQLSQLM